MDDKPAVDHNFWIGLRNAMLIQLAVAAVVCVIVFFVAGCSGGSSTPAPVASEVVNTTPTGPDPPSVTPSTTCPSGETYEPQTGTCSAPLPILPSNPTTPPPTCSGTGCSNAPSDPTTPPPDTPVNPTVPTTPPPSTPTTPTCVLPAVNVDGVCTTYPPPNWGQVPTATYDVNGVPQLQWSAVANNPQDTDDATLTCMVGTSGPYPASDTLDVPLQASFTVVCTESLDGQTATYTANLVAPPPATADVFTYSGSLAIGLITFTWHASSPSAQCGVTVYDDVTNNVIASSPYYAQIGTLQTYVSSHPISAWLQCPQGVNDTNVSPNPIIVTS